MKNLAVIIQKLTGGGAERAACNLSVALEKYYRVHLIVFDGSSPAYPYSGTLHDLQLPPRQGAVGKLFNLIRRTRRVRRIKREEQIDVSVSLMDGANLVNILSRCKDRIYPSIRNQLSKEDKRTYNGRLRVLDRLALQILAKHSDKVVAVSEGVADDLVRNCGLKQDQVISIANMCDGDLIRNSAEEHREEAADMGGKSFTTMGRLIGQKGQWHLLRAFRKVTQDFPDAELYILGDGPLGEKLKALSADLGIAEQVHYLGYVRSPHAYIQKSLAFVLPSLFEGMSNTLLEALNCGTPIIATDCESGSREVLAPGTGLPHPVEAVEYAAYGILTAVGDAGHFNAGDELTEDEEQLAEAMRRILGDEQTAEHYRRRSVERAEAFSFETIGKKWKELMGD